MSLGVNLFMDIDTGDTELYRVDIFESNITHNLAKMAQEAGIYTHLWHPEDMDATLAGDIISGLEAGLQLLIEEPTRFERLTPVNGWGNYTQFVSFVQIYLLACQLHPKARIATST